eukprot:3712645-Prorocentrum_lima.AAC.1
MHVSRTRTVWAVDLLMGTAQPPPPTKHPPQHLRAPSLRCSVRGGRFAEFSGMQTEPGVA